MSLQNKSVLVTGASRGIGLSIVRQLLEQNAKVMGTSRKNPVAPPVSEHPGFSYRQLDLANARDLDNFLDRIDKQGWPDVVVNNAGISRESALTESNENWNQVWEETLLVNLEAPAKICKRAISYWLNHNREGIIINIASRAAYRGDTPEYAAYGASKGGLVAFTKSISRGLGKKGIVAYSIAPGFVETDMARESVSVYGESYLTEGLSFDDLTQPEEVAEMVAFLSSGKVKHMTGTTFHINGGSYLI
jgi:3-oxoacyl-[acyl-carrier protein] reductase